MEVCGGEGGGREQFSNKKYQALVMRRCSSTATGLKRRKGSKQLDAYS